MIILRAIAVGIAASAWIMSKWCVYFAMRFMTESGIPAYLGAMNVLHRAGAEMVGIHNAFLITFTLLCLAAGLLISSLYGPVEAWFLNLLRRALMDAVYVAQRAIAKVRARRLTTRAAAR